MAVKIPSSEFAVEPPGCTLRQLPEEERVAAARTAMAVNPMNAPQRAMLPSLLATIVDEPAHLAVLTTKWWGQDGVKLSVGFLEPTSAELRRRILGFANCWGEYANVEFLEADSPAEAQIRISFGTGGYWSYLGTDILHVPKSQQTMNLERIGMGTSDAECERVVVHEFGHSAGFFHEHMLPAMIALLDPEKVIAFYMPSQGWTRQQVIQQILSPPPPGSIMATAEPDDVSIMCYPFPGSVTRSGKPIPGGMRISRGDAAFAAKLYPKPDAPQPPPSPPPPAGGSKVTIDIYNAERISIPGYKVVKA